jgi:hypothetical protein
MTDNGKPDTATATQLAQGGYDQDEMSKPWLHPDALTPGDHLRAKVALAELLGERSPYELLGGDEMYPYIMWCLRSRDDPSFTWEQALATPFYEFRMSGGPPMPPPPTASPASPGSRPTTPGGTDATTQRRAPTSERSSEPSST